MSETGGQEIPEEHREEPFGPLGEENVTGAEYEFALENLRRFAKKDVTEIDSLDDLAFDMRFVGKGLRTVVLSSGEIQETKFDYQHPDSDHVKAVDRVRVIRQPVGDGSATITVLLNVNGGRAYIDQHRLEDGDELSNFTATVPTDEEIQASSTMQNRLTTAYAVDWRGGRTVSYYPGNEPNNPQVLQGYAIVVQDGVKNVLEIAKPPTPLPPIE
jgi:hypothetical protein